MKESKLFQALLAGFSGLGVYLSGLEWEVIIIWFLLAVIDMITGAIKSGTSRTFNSKSMRNGLFKKSSEFFLIMGLLLTQRVAIYMGVDVPIATIFIGAFCFKEFASIMENAISMDVKIPVVVKKWFKITNENLNDEDKEDDNK